jgi:FkbH-like protein
MPEVAVPELPADPVFYAEVLLAAGYFEAVRFTAEDRTRADQYRANAVRASSLGATDLESHLRSLDMRAICGPFDKVGRARIVQLINKTNQFNLTARRYTESEVKAFEMSSSGLTLQTRLVDRFGDNGMIAVVICIERGKDWVIDTWLMSCRVLNRRVEHATLNHIVARAKAAGARTLIGQYLKTDRNGVVKEHYPRLGFAELHDCENESWWQLDVESYVPAAVPIEMVANAV